MSSIIVILSVIVLAYAQQTPISVHLSNVHTETFHRGMHTTGRRTTPITQLQCTQNCVHAWKINTVQCTNVGENSVGEFQWKCVTDEMPTGMNFGHLTVECEGFNYPGDSNILKGSCGLKYELIGYPSTGYQSSDYVTRTTYSHDGIDFVAGVVIIGMFIAFCVLLCCCTGSSPYVSTYDYPTPYPRYFYPSWYYGPSRTHTTTVVRNSEPSTRKATGYAGTATR